MIVVGDGPHVVAADDHVIKAATRSRVGMSRVPMIDPGESDVREG
jgi:hypothetical protein